eukprot:gene14986-6141_t
MEDRRDSQFCAVGVALHEFCSTDNDDKVFYEPDDDEKKQVQLEHHSNEILDPVESIGEDLGDEMPCDDETFQSPAVDISLVNTSLSSMGESPIQPKKLAGSKRYSKEKLDRIAGAFRKKLKIYEEVDVVLGKIQKSIQYYNEMISQVKERFTRAENKSEQMTVLPKTWSIRKVGKEFNVSNYLARKSKKLVQQKGVLSTPNPKLGNIFREGAVSAPNCLLGSSSTCGKMQELREELAEAKRIEETQKLHAFIPVEGSTTELITKEYSRAYDKRQVSVVPVQPHELLSWESINGYITCKYDGKWWLAYALHKMKERNEAEIRFLHPSGPAASFMYPAKYDILIVQREDILTKVNPTTATEGPINNNKGKLIMQQNN